MSSLQTLENRFFGVQKRALAIAVFTVVATFSLSGCLRVIGDSLGNATISNLSSAKWADSSGNIYVSDSANFVIRKINASTGIITTVAGNGTFGYSGDGGPAINAQLGYPGNVIVDNFGNLYIADSTNNLIRKVDASSGIITTVAGVYGAMCTQTQVDNDEDNCWSVNMPAGGYTGDGGPATNAQLDWPVDISVDQLGNLYIVDNNNQAIRKVNASSGIITTVAGNGISGYSGDGGLATSAELSSPAAITLDNSGNLYIAEDGNSVIRKVDASSGIITTIAGNGIGGYSGDGGPATSAEFNELTGLIFNADSSVLYVSDNSNNLVRKIDMSTGIVSRFVGTGVLGFSGDGGLATNAELSFVYYLARDPSGNLLIMDGEDWVGNGTSLVRKVDLSSGVISTIAGTPGTLGYSGDGGPATSATFNFDIGGF